MSMADKIKHKSRGQNQSLDVSQCINTIKEHNQRIQSKNTIKEYNQRIQSNTNRTIQ